MTLSPLLSFIIIAGPGMIIAAEYLQSLFFAERLVVGAVMGAGGFLFSAYLSRNTSFGFIAFYLVAAYSISLFLALYLRSKRAKLAGSLATPPGDYAASQRLFWALLGAVFVCASIPLFFTEFPFGGDPAYHLIIVKKMLLNGILPVDWSPFAPVGVNYPLGSHILVAGMARISGAPAEQAFKACFPIMSLLSCGMVYLVAQEIFRDRRQAFLAAYTASFITNSGTLSSYCWGGLPNMVGILFLVTSVWAASVAFPRGLILLSGFMMACVFMTHHHVMLEAFVMLFAFSLSGLQAFISPAGDKAYAAFAKRMFLAFIFALILASFYLPAYVREALRSRSVTTVFTLTSDQDPVMGWRQILSFGPVFLLLLCWGFILMRKAKEKYIIIRWWLIAMTAAFLSLGVLYRIIAVLLYGKNLSAFNSARFLGNLAFPLSIIASIGLAALLAKLKYRFLMVAFFLIFLANPFIVLAQTHTLRLFPAEKMALDWIREHTPANALIINNSVWMPYVSWRQGTFLYLPATEPIRHRTFREFHNLERSGPAELVRWVKSHKRPAYLCMSNLVPLPAEFKLVFDNEYIRIYEISE